MENVSCDRWFKAAVYSIFVFCFCRMVEQLLHISSNGTQGGHIQQFV